MAQATPPTLRDSFHSIPSQTRLSQRNTQEDVADTNKAHRQLLSWSFSRNAYDSDRDSYAESLNSLSATLKEKLMRQSGILAPSPSHSAQGGVHSPKSYVSISGDELVQTPTGLHGQHSNPHGQSQPSLHPHVTSNNTNNEDTHFSYKKNKKNGATSAALKSKSPTHKKMGSVTFSSTVSLFSDSEKRKNSILFYEVHGVPANTDDRDSVGSNFSGSGGAALGGLGLLVRQGTNDSSDGYEMKSAKNKKKVPKRANKGAKGLKSVKAAKNDVKPGAKGKVGKVGKVGKAGKVGKVGNKGVKSRMSGVVAGDNESGGNTIFDARKNLGKKKRKAGKKKAATDKGADDEKAEPRAKSTVGIGGKKKRGKRKKNAMAESYLAKLKNGG